MISPTGKGIRNDSEGSGEYGSRRGERRHNGVDYICVEGQDIVAPFDMYISRISNPKRDSLMSGIKWETEKSYGKLFYFLPDKNLIGKDVKEGDVIGTAQDVSRHYGLKDMIPHLHFQVDK